MDHMYIHSLRYNNGWIRWILCLIDILGWIVLNDFLLTVNELIDCFDPTITTQIQIHPFFT
jgi:hypothetical protein